MDGKDMTERVHFWWGPNNYHTILNSKDIQWTQKK